MSQRWFSELDAMTSSRHPLSDDEQSQGFLSQRTASASTHVIDESVRRGLLSNLHVKQFFQSLSTYANNLVHKLSESASLFYSYQVERGIPPMAQMSEHKIFLETLDYCTRWTPEMWEAEVVEIGKLSRLFESQLANSFNVFLLEYFAGEKSVLSALEADQQATKEMFPMFLAKAPGSIYYRTPKSSLFLMTFVGFLIKYAPVRSKEVLSNWLVMLDAVNYAMIESMIELSDSLVKVLFDTKKIEFTRRDDFRQTSLVSRERSEGRSTRAPLLPEGDIKIPSSRYFRDVKVPSQFDRGSRSGGAPYTEIPRLGGSTYARSRRGEAVYQHGEAVYQHGDTASRRGDTASRREETASRREETASRRGESAASYANGSHARLVRDDQGERLVVQLPKRT